MENIPNDYSKFDAEWYVEKYYATKEAQKYMLPEIQILHKLVHKSGINGGCLLDIGTGPMVHSILSASALVEEVYLSDYSSVNLNYLKQWLQGGKHTPTRIMQNFINIDGTRLTMAKREKVVRSKVKGILHIDVNSRQPLGTWDKIREFDVIVSCCCVEAATSTIEECQQAVINMTSLLKKGGTIILIGGLGRGQYEVGDTVYQTLKLSKPALEGLLQKAGLTVQFYEEIFIEDRYGDLYNSSTGVSCFYVAAKRL